MPIRDPLCCFPRQNPSAALRLAFKFDFLPCFTFPLSTQLKCTRELFEFSDWIMQSFSASFVLRCLKFNVHFLCSLVDDDGYKPLWDEWMLSSSCEAVHPSIFAATLLVLLRKIPATMGRKWLNNGIIEWVIERSLWRSSLGNREKKAEKSISILKFFTFTIDVCDFSTSSYDFHDFVRHGRKFNWNSSQVLTKLSSLSFTSCFVFVMRNERY